jgi:hypothetical protein
MSPDPAQQLKERLGELVHEADAMGVSHTDAIKAILTWAVEQTYATGGYPHTRLVMLDVLEHILLQEITNKNAA